MTFALDPLYWQQIAAALCCGIIVGGPRQWRGKTPGIRTSILITLGCMEFTRLGAFASAAAGHDRLRVIGQIVVGIGFLGGGVILHNNGRVQGINAAVRIWFLAGVASAIGVGLIEMGLTITVATAIILEIFARVEQQHAILSADANQTDSQH